MAIDGGAVGEILEFVHTAGLELDCITNTHAHSDHTTGNRELAERSGGKLCDHSRLADEGGIVLEGQKVRVFHTPGHTEDSVAFQVDNCLITGDTLFNGTVGNCFSGDLKAFFESIRKIMEMPKKTVIYAGHDYVEYAMAFAKLVEPQNMAIQPYIDRYDPSHIYSTLGDELQVNPFVRYNDPDLIAVLKERNLATETEYQRFESAMHLE